MTEPSPRRRSTNAALVALCYLPFLASSPGQLSADTKEYLYLDPSRLMRSAANMWDPNIALGYVPHQNIGYLWPMGPWFWCLDAVGLPDWVAQRLWWGTLFLAAAAGVMALGRWFGWRREARIAAAFVYTLSPYSLAFLAQISAILLAWAALPWLLVLAAKSVRTRGWRHPALFTLVAATAGSSNLTALLLVGVGTLLWLVHITCVAREEPWREVLRATARIAVLTLGASASWMAGLVVQAGHGSEILRYSETAEAVTSASSANEVLRGLGNWFFYGADRLGPWIEQSVPYSQSIPLLIVTQLLPTLALVLAAVVRWRHRSFAVGLVVVGLFVSVGAYPWADPPPLGRLVQKMLLTDQGLALRALNRATPLLVLGLALLIGAAISAVAVRAPRTASSIAAVVVLLAVAGLPALWRGALVPRNLARPEEVPSYWRAAADHLNAEPDTTRVLEVPGSDFASYRWGSTVDPISPGLLDRSVAYRELIPFAPPESAALLDALDLGLQERTLPSAAIAPIARLMRAGDLLVRSDLEYERFNTPRPKNLYDLILRAPGLGSPVGFGPGRPNRADPTASLEDEVALLSDHLLADPPEVAVVPVEDPVPLVATHAVDHPIVLSGDAFGIVDLAEAGLIDGRELLRFSAGLDDRDVRAAAESGASFVITDTNRKRAQRWNSIRYTQGFTETATGGLLERDLADNRLPFFESAGLGAKTIAVDEGGLTATASSVGSPFTLSPDARPAAASDGDPTTAWRTGGQTDPRGEHLRLTLDRPTTTDVVRLLQADIKQPNRWVRDVELRFDGGAPMGVHLDRSSRAGPGQAVVFPSRTFRTLDIEITDVTTPRHSVDRSLAPVGFAEVAIGAEPPSIDEWIRTPVDLVHRLEDDAGPAITVVLTRLRTDPTEFVHDDDERRIARIVALPAVGPMQVQGTARLSARANDAALEEVLHRGGGVVVGAEARMEGSVETGASALDGDPTTWWISPRSSPTTFAVRFSAARATTVDHLDLQVVDDGRFSVPSELELSVDGGSAVTVAVPPVVAGATEGTVVPVRVDLPTALTGRHFSIRVSRAHVRRVIDWNSKAPIAQPVAIAELGVPGVIVPALPATFDSGCRSDLVEVDGVAVPVRVTGSMADALAARPLEVRGCASTPALAEGDHRVRTAIGRNVGLDIDQIVLRSASAVPGSLLQPAPPSAAAATVHSASSTHLGVTVTGDPGATVWLVYGDSYDSGWTATSSGQSLGAPVLVDGFANGWQVRLDQSGRAQVAIRFAPQRFVRLAIALSFGTFLLCAGLAWWGRAALTADGPGPSLRRRRRRPLVARPTPIRVIVTGLGCGLVALLVLPPGLCVVVGVAGALGHASRQSARLIRFAPAVVVAAVAIAVVVDQGRSHRLPGPGWATGIAVAHELAVLSVVLLGVDAVVARRWDHDRRVPPT